MGEDLEVLLMGDEPGIAEAAHDFNVAHVKNVRQNEQGTPLISSIFDKAEENSQASLLMFVNTDMLLLPETKTIASEVQENKTKFVLLGQRYDLDVDHKLDYSPGWIQRLREDVQSRGNLHPLGGSDYFIFPRDLFKDIPEFAVGRAGWDNWVIYHGISQGWLVVDATPSIMAVHQNHGYSHLAREQSHQRHPETMQNLELAGGMRKMYSLLDVEYRLVGGKIQTVPWSLPRALHRLERKLQPDELVGRGPRWCLLRGVRKLRRAFQGTRRN